MSFLLIIFLLGAAQAGIHLGCYKENMRRRHFDINPGDYSPELTSVKTCMAACGSYDFAYSATTSGKLCYCANTLPDISFKEANSDCDITCPGDSSYTCGGKLHASVYKSSKKITGLAMTSDAANKIIEVGTLVNLEVTIDQGMDVIYKMNYGDGAGLSSPNVTSMKTRTFYIPGEYPVTVHANDQNQTFPDVVAATAVRVFAPAGPLEVICDSIFATHEPGKCALTAWLGNDLNVAVNVDGISNTAKIEDPPLSLAGPPIKAKESDPGDDLAARYLMIASEFSQTGKVLGWELYVDTVGTGTLSMLILKPKCSNTYCYSSNTCTAGTCDSANLLVSNCPSDPFCMQHAICSTSCTSPSSRYTSTATDYEVVDTVTVSVSVIGYQYIAEAGEVLVEPGYIVGLEHTVGDVILGRQAAETSEDDRKFAAGAATVGTSLTVSGGSLTSYRLAVRAVASGGSKVHLPYIFTNPGNHSLTATAASPSLPGTSPTTFTTTVRVLEGIDAAIIDSPAFAKSGEVVTVTVLPHTGNFVFYNWTFGPDVFLETTTISRTPTFATRGVYLINVTVYNSVSNKNNHTWIQVEDELLGLVLSADHTTLGDATDIAFSLTKGSNYTCTWDYGDSSTEDFTDDVSTPQAGASQTHTYTNKGTYTLDVDCRNNVSTISQTLTLRVQEAITNLHMEKEGANKNTDYYLEWALDSGSEVTFVLTFNGNPITTHTVVDTHRWKSDVQTGQGPASMPLTLAASNLVSNSSISISFVILSVIIDPTFVSDRVNESSHTPITFTADMTSGSDVTLVIDWDDGSSATPYVAPPNIEWPASQTYTHSYLNGGIFNVKATFTNKEGSYDVVVTVTVLVSVNIIQCKMDNYALYHPPANVNLTLEASQLPTDPTLHLHWGESHGVTLTPSLVLNKTYTYIYGDTGSYLVNATISNMMGTKKCEMNLIVVEHLSQPSFDQKFSKAAVGLPFDITFCLNRGPSGSLCNLTYEYGDTTTGVYDRTGKGQDGCDTHQVTYNDKISKTVKVTARSPLETVDATMTVGIIDGILDSSVTDSTVAGNAFGGPSVFSVTYSGGTAPTTPRIKWIYGDNDNNEENDNALTTPTHTQSHTYTKDGVFIATMIIYNDATKVERNITVGVYKSFASLVAEAYFLLDIPPGQIERGGYAGSGMYPQNKQIWFNVTDGNNAFAETYTAKLTNTKSGVITTYTHNTSVFFINFPSVDIYTVEITATNPVDSASITPLSLTMFELITGFEVVEAQAKVKSDEPKIFNVSFEAQGTETCLYVHFKSVDHKEIYSDKLPSCTMAGFESVAEADKHSLTGLTSLTYTYTTDDYYELLVIAKNLKSEEEKLIGFSITGLDCAKPSVDIHDRRSDFTKPALFKRSGKIQILGLSIIQCATSYDNQKSWEMEKMNPQLNTVIKTIDLGSVETSKAELNLPIRFLDVGLYRVHYIMEMEGSYGSSSFKATTYSYLQVDASDLIGVMVKGGVSEITRGRGQLSNLELKPLDFSYDPDLDPLPSDQGLEIVSWTCHLSGSPSQTAECDAAGLTTSGTNSQTLIMSKFSVGTYVLRASIETKDPGDSRKTTTEINLIVVDGDPPAITILPGERSVYYQKSSEYIILESSRFAMNCLCDTCAANEVLDYRWELFLHDYRWPDGWRLLEETQASGLVLGLRSKQISLEVDFFSAFKPELMKIDCEVTKENGDKGSVGTRLRVNKPPSGGWCKVSPLNITYTPEKAWTIEVDDWEDEDGLDKYRFFIHTSDDEVDREITSNSVTSPYQKLDVSLSEGYDFNDYKEDIIIKVYDKLGAVSEYKCGTVVVRPLPLSDVNKLMDDIVNNQLSDLNKLFAEGDQKTCTEKMTGIFSALNSASKRSGTVYAGYRVASNEAGSMYGRMGEDRPSYQKTTELLKDDPIGQFNMESDRDKRAETRVKIINQLEKLEAKSITAVIQLGNTVAQACEYGDEIGKGVQLAVMDSLDSMVDFMVGEEGATTEELETGVKNIFASCGNMMDASGGNGEFPTLTEAEEAKEAEEFSVYDTDPDADPDPEMEWASSIDEAIEIQKRRVHKQQQAEIAAKLRNRVNSVMDKCNEVFGSYSVPGQTLQINTPKMKVAMQKTEAQDLGGKTLDVENSVGGCALPNMTLLPGIGKDEPVVLSVSQTTNHPLRYTDAAQALSSTTNFIHVNIYSKDNTKFKVSGMAEPVKVVIPRDANAEVPSYVSVNPNIPSWNNLMYFVVTINRTNSALFMDFSDIKKRQFLIVVKLGAEPKIKPNQTDDVCDRVYLMPTSMAKHSDKEDINRYRLIIGKDELKDFTGKVYLGIRELNSTEYDMDISGGCDNLPRYSNDTDYFKGNFSLRQYVSQCLAISDSENDWSTNGCWVSKETAVDKTVCLCTHMTTFAGGWVVVPNTIDWSYVFANADFLSNPTIYITQIVIVVLFILGAIYARRQDKKMAEKLGLAPLPDNEPKDKYIYEVVVCTGMRRNAGTNSQVCFILSGEDDETDVRAFSDSKRKIFRRGEIDGFLMTVPSCLGYLNFIRIWHDNSGKGKFGSWYLNYVMVRDVQTGDKQVFIANKWLAVEEDDGQVDRVLPVAGKEQLADFSYQFGERTRKNLSDGHLWFSVVARPPQSRFTCLQRVSCILCLLYVTMLTNAMFYKTTPEEESSNNGFSIGPFSVSPEQIFIGVISNLIVFPVNFLLVFFFRKTRPHHKRPSRIDRAIHEVHEQANKQTNPNDIKPEVSSIFSVSKSPTIPSDPHRPDTAASRSATVMSMASEDAYPKKKKKCELPWYFIIVAWGILIVVTLGAGCMVTFYGISFKDETCKKWISSMLVSFFMSVFITQPFKVFLFAIILSVIIKNPAEEKEDEEDDEEVHDSNNRDNDFLHDHAEGFGATRPKKVGYKPPDPALLEKYRQKRLKEIKMWAIIREMIMYVFFLWILMVISYRQLGPSNFLYKDTMHRVFIANNDTKIDFHALRNTDEFWIWAKSGLVNGIRAGSYYNDYPPLKLRSYVNDKVSRILGYAIMRQLRIKPALCEIPDKMETVISQCNVGYHILDQEQGSFMPGWEPLSGNETVNSTRPEYTYRNANSLNGYPYWGTLAWYSGGGYVVPMLGSKQHLMDKMDELHNEGWVDKYTRAIFVEFTVYNPQVNLFSINTILAEFHPSGGLVQSFRFEPAMLLPYMDSAMLFQLIIQGVYIIFTLFFIVRELKELIRTRLNYFKSFWNLVEIGIIAMSIAAIVIYFYRLFVTLDLTEQFKSTDGNGYVKFQYVAYWNEMLSYMIGFLVFFATLKFLKLLRFNKKITLLSATLHHSAKSLLHFSIIYAIVFLAFAQLFYLTYMNIDIAYSTFVNSVVASVLMMMGKFNIYTMIMKEPVLTQVFVLLFVVTVTFIMVNMFISILNETFTVVREDINKQGNDYEIVDFMVNSFRKWTGMGGTPENHDVDPAEWNNRTKGTDGPPNRDPDCVDDFPDRIDRLLQSISAVYTDNENFAKMYKKKPFESGSMNAKSFLRDGRSPSPAPGELRNRKDSSDVMARVHTH